MQKTASFNNVAIVSVKGNDCRICFWYINKDDIMKNSNLKEKIGSLRNIILFFMYP